MASIASGATPAMGVGLSQLLLTSVLCREALLYRQPQQLLQATATAPAVKVPDPRTLTQALYVHLKPTRSSDRCSWHCCKGLAAPTSAAASRICRSLNVSSHLCALHLS
jgi:hypothetical protein